MLLVLGAALLALPRPSSAQPGGTRVTDGPIQSGPTINPTGGPTANINPVGGINTNTQINTQTAVPGADIGINPATPQTKAAVGNQGQIAAPNSGQIASPQNGISPGVNRGVTPTNSMSVAPANSEATPSDSGKITPAPGQTQGAARNGTQQIKTAAEQLKKDVAPPSGGIASDPVSDLSHFFDAAHIYDAKTAGPSVSGGGVVGSELGARDRVIANVRIANDRATPPADVPGLYLAGLAVAREAAKAGALPKAMAEKVVAKIIEYASQKAQTSLPELANNAYAAAASGEAGQRAVERAVGPQDSQASAMGMEPAKPSSFDQWQELLGKPDRPLISNLPQLKKDVWRVEDESSKPGAVRTGWAPKISFREEAGSLVAALPGSSVSRVPELTANLPLGSDIAVTGEDMAAYDSDPSPANAFRLVRHRAGLASAVVFYLKSTAMSLWQSLWEGFLSLIGRGPAQTLSRISRAPSAEEAPAAAQGITVFADLSALNGPFLAAQRLLDRPGTPTVAEARRALAQAAELAHAVGGVTFNGAGARSIRGLQDRIARQTAGLSDDEPLPGSVAALLRPGEGGGLPFWLDRLHDSAMKRLDAAALAKLAGQPAPAIILADLAGGQSSGMIRAYLKAADGGRLASGLEALGFRLENSGGAVSAVYDWDSGSQGAGSALAGALTLIKNGAAAAESAAVADSPEVSKLVSAFLKHTGKDRLADIEAADPGFMRFSPAEVVQSGRRSFWVERSRGRLDGKLQDLYLLRDLRTRRPLYGQAVLVPSH